MTAMLSKPQSKYVKNKIKGLEFNEKNRFYIDDLLCLERAAKGQPGGCAGAMRAHSIAERYPKECKAIKDELYPLWREDEKRGRMLELCEERKMAAKEKKELKEDRKLWASLGGRNKMRRR